MFQLFSIVPGNIKDKVKRAETSDANLNSSETVNKLVFDQCCGVKEFVVSVYLIEIEEKSSLKRFS